MNRLEMLCRLFNWNGGTIAQANVRLSKLLGYRVDALVLPESVWQQVYVDAFDKLYLAGWETM